MFGVCKGGWVLPRNLHTVQLRLALQNAVNVFPWFSSRIIDINNESWTMHCANQGIKMDTVCHPSLSIHPTDGTKYDELQRAVRPEHRNMFFTADKAHLIISKRHYETAPVVTIQLNHLGVSNLDEVTPETPCIVTFKLNHGVGDGYTGYLLMQYISDYLSGADLSGYDDVHYGRFLGDDDPQKPWMKKEEFKDVATFGEKYGIQSDGTPTWVMPNMSITRQTRFKTILNNLLFYMIPYLLPMNMDYFELRFTADDIDEIRNELMNRFSDDHQFKKERLTTFECLTAFLSPLIGKYDSSTGLFKQIHFPLNLRERTTKFGKYTIGNPIHLVAVGVEDETGSMEYNPSNVALKIHEALDRNGRIRNDEDFTQRITNFLRDFFSVIRVHGFRYSMGLTVTEILHCQFIIWNEFRSIKPYEKYQFGLDQRPLFYMYNASYSLNRFVLLDAPDDPKGVRVIIQMPRAKAKKLKEAETAFLSKYEVPVDSKSF